MHGLRVGCCEVIISDQRRELVNKVKEELQQLSGMEHCVTSAYHRQSNGITERFNQALQTALVKVVNDTQANRFSTTRTMLTPWYVCALALSISVWVCVWVGVQAPMSAVYFFSGSYSRNTCARESKKGDKMKPCWNGLCKIHSDLGKGVYGLSNPKSGNVLKKGSTQPD